MTATWSARDSASSWSWVTRMPVALGGAQGVGDRAAGALAQPGVERGERLVEQHHRGRGRERPGQRDALLLAAGELVRQPRCSTADGSPTSSSSSATPGALAAAAPRGRPKAMLAATSRCGNSAPSCGT